MAMGATEEEDDSVIRLFHPLLSTLDVDSRRSPVSVKGGGEGEGGKSRTESSSSVGPIAAAADLDEMMGGGGMNWGNIAIYSCEVSCDEYREEFVVLQDSVDGMPFGGGNGGRRSGVGGRTTAAITATTATTTAMTGTTYKDDNSDDDDDRGMDDEMTVR